MNKLAYSYLRFSTPEQAGGDSRRRQLDLARAYAARHGLVLDAGLSFRDLGMSAFHGRNVREGALRAFLDTVELGLVPRGSHLLVESLDRLSRDRVLLAQSLFLRIIEAGITIVTLIDDRSYSAESLNRSPMDLIVSLVCMMRASTMAGQKQRPSVVASNLLARPGAAPARSVPVEDFPRAVPDAQANVPAPSASPDPEPAAQSERAPGGIKAATIGTTLYLLPAEHKRVRRLALDMDVPTVHELLLLGLDRLLAEQGELPIIRYSEPRPKKG